MWLCHDGCGSVMMGVVVLVGVSVLSGYCCDGSYSYLTG